MRKLSALACLLGSLSASLAAGNAAAQTQAPAPACGSAQHRAFDFWLGEWDVFTPDGKQSGSNSISKEYDGCVLHERYTTPRPYQGESLNMYDSVRKTWHQTWVDNSGTLLLLDGGMLDNSMVLTGKGVDEKGQAVMHKISWTPNPDGSVRQHWQTRLLKGKAKWETAFDGKYVRRK